MHRVLRANLDRAKRFYDTIDTCLDVHLGVADKYALTKHLEKTDHTCWQDIYRDTFYYLEEMGYTSTSIAEYRKEVEKNGNDWVDKWYSTREDIKRKIK